MNEITYKNRDWKVGNSIIHADLKNAPFAEAMYADMVAREFAKGQPEAITITVKVDITFTLPIKSNEEMAKDVEKS